MNTSTPRRLAARSPGQRHGPITRLISPGDEGHATQPVVFLDYVEAPAGSGPRFGFHPHSGIATLTFPLTFDVEHEASTGQVDRVRQRGLEWVLAGRGIWHRGRALPGPGGAPLAGFQMWLAMPPSHELAEPHARFVQPAEVPREGPVTLLLGTHGGLASPLAAPLDANVLWVELRDGESWRYEPPPTHQGAWVFAQQGALDVGGTTLRRELGLFEEGDGALEFRAEGDCAFLLGSAARHGHDLVLGSHSVHTHEAALAAGAARIRDIGQRLRREGRLG